MCSCGRRAASIAGRVDRGEPAAFVPRPRTPAAAVPQRMPEASGRVLALPPRLVIVPAMVRFAEVGLRYAGSGSEVLRDLNFTLDPGSFHWLLGPSGAGKSSLLRLMHLAV